MTTLLSIETSGPYCSVCLSRDEKILASRVAKEVNQHSAVLHDFIEEVFLESAIGKDELSGIAISSGPGSYTGLRIGLSTAKGLAYALNVPIVEISTLRSLAYQMNMVSSEGSIKETGIFVPMIDAGRMEVYYAIYDSNLAELKAPAAGILSDEFFNNVIFDKKWCKNEAYFAGNGSNKGSHFHNEGALRWINGVDCAAHSLLPLALIKMREKSFADLAYCLPTYVKKYIPGKSKK